MTWGRELWDRWGFAWWLYYLGFCTIMCICPFSLLSNPRVHYCPIPTPHQHHHWHTFGDDLILNTFNRHEAVAEENSKAAAHLGSTYARFPPSPWYHYPTIFVPFGREPVSPCPDILLYDSRETISSFKVKSDFKTHPKRATSSPAFSLQRFLPLYRARSCHKTYSSAVVGLWVGLGGNIQS